MEALKIDTLSRSFKGVNALSRISLNVELGERRAIIGPNGAGKTTLINVVSGVLFPSYGRIYLFGHDISSIPLHQRPRFGLARSFQLNSLFLELTLFDNVFLALQGTRLSLLQMLRSTPSHNKFRGEAAELLQRIGLWEKRNHLAKALSHGEQRQLEITLCIGSGAKLLLLDEPSAGLAPAETAIFVDMIRDLPRSITVIFCAHDLELVFSLAERVTILHQGQVFAEGTPEEIRVDSRVKEIYLGA